MNKINETKTKLKACPFKHRKKAGKRQDLEVMTIGGYFVKCRICEAEGPGANSKYWAVKKWNERVGRK